MVVGNYKNNMNNNVPQFIPDNQADKYFGKSNVPTFIPDNQADQFFKQPVSQETKTFGQKVGDFFTGNTQEFGKTVGESINAPHSTEMYNKAVEDHINQSNSLLKLIKQRQTNGQDTTKLQEVLNQYNQEMPKLEDFVGQDTARRLNETQQQNAEEIGGQALGTALEATSGGVLGGLEGKSVSIGGKVLQGAKIGAIYGGVSGASDAMKNQQDLGEVLKETKSGVIAGGLTGGAIAGGSAIVNDILTKLPTRIVKNAIPGLDEKGANYLLENKPVGTVSKLFKDSADSVVNLNTQIDTILKHPDLIDEKIDTPKLLNEILYGKNGQSNYTDATIEKVMKQLAPEKAKLIDKIMNGEANLYEANEVKKALYSQTKKVFTDAPNITAKKKLGADIATSIANTIKTQAKETGPIFDKMAKEINLRNALLKVFKKQDAQKLIGMYDLASMGVGGTIAGLPGAVAGDIGRKIVSNPSTKIIGAKILKTVGKANIAPKVIKTLNTTL